MMSLHLPEVVGNVFSSDGMDNDLYATCTSEGTIIASHAGQTTKLKIRSRMGKVKVPGSPRKLAISSRRRKSLKQNEKSYLRQALSDVLNFKYLKLFTAFASSFMPVLNPTKEDPDHDQSTNEEKEIDVNEDDGFSRLQINFIRRKSRRLTDRFSFNQEGDLIADSGQHLSRRRNSMRLSKRYNNQGEARRDVNGSLDGVDHISSWNSTPISKTSLTITEFYGKTQGGEHSSVPKIPTSRIQSRPSRIPRRIPSTTIPRLPPRVLEKRDCEKSRIPRPIPFELNSRTTVSEISSIPIPIQDIPKLKSINPISKPSFKKHVHDHQKCLRRKSSVLSAGLQQALLVKGKSSIKLKKVHLNFNRA